MNGQMLAAAVLLAALLGGCSGGEADAPGAAASPDRHALRGVVVDPAVRPLEGVLVSIPARPEVPPATTGADGAFTLASVEAGVVFLAVSRDGYLSSTVQVLVEGVERAVVRIVLSPLEETRPYAVLEKFRGHIECGAGSAPAFGLSAGCMVLLGGTLYVACTGSDPVPPTGICIGGTSPYFVSMATGDMAVAQTEVVWQPTVSGLSELLVGSYVIDRNGTVLGGAPSATGQSVLVRRLDAAMVDELDLGRTTQLAIFVNPGNSGPANAVVQQAFDVYHTSTFFFEPDAAWVFARDGPVPVPEACTSCAG